MLLTLREGPLNVFALNHSSASFDGLEKPDLVHPSPHSQPHFPQDWAWTCLNIEPLSLKPSLWVSLQRVPLGIQNAANEGIPWLCQPEPKKRWCSILPTLWASVGKQFLTCSLIISFGFNVPPFKVLHKPPSDDFAPFCFRENAATEIHMFSWPIFSLPCNTIHGSAFSRGPPKWMVVLSFSL